MRPVKSNNGGIGGAGLRWRDRSSKLRPTRRKFRPMRRTPLKPFSAKKRAIMRENKKNLEILLAEQHRLFGTTFCELKDWAIRTGEKKLFKGPCGPGGSKLVVEHVLSWKDQIKTDIKLQGVACVWHNLERGSRKFEYRQPARLESLKDFEKNA